MTKATLLLFNAARLIDLCPLRRVLDHNFTVFIDHVCSANPTIKTNKRKMFYNWYARFNEAEINCGIAHILPFY